MARVYFLAYFIFTSCFAAGQSQKYVLKGTTDHLKPAVPGQPTTILWKHNGNKVVEFDGSEQNAYHPYDGRITLDWHTAELEITGLRFEDSGEYVLEVEMNHNLHTSKIKLEVIDKVVKPTISCEKNEDSKTKATLLCSAKPVKPESLMKFEWSSKGMFHHGPKLQITLGDEHDEVEYSCSVSNPLSSETASFAAKECYNDQSSSVPLIVGLVLLFLLLLLVIALGVFFCKWKQKVCFATHDVEKQSRTEGAWGEKTQKEETENLIGKEETLPSKQHLVQGEDTSKAADEDQGSSPPKGRVKERIQFYNKGGNSDTLGPSQKDKGVENNESENEEPVSTHLSSTRAELFDNKEENHQHQANISKHSNEEDSGSFISAVEEQNDPGLADVSGQSPEDEQFGLKADAEQSGSENNQGEQEEPGSAPASLRSDSSTEQDPDHESSDIYTSNPDPVKLQEGPEKEVLQPESSDTEQANKQGQVSPPKGSTDDDPQSHSSVSTDQNDPGSAEVLGKSPEDKQAGPENEPGKSVVETTLVCAEIKSGESKEPSTSSEPAPSQDQDHHPDINKDKSGAEQAAETGPSQQNPSDLMKAQGPAGPAASRPDGETVQESGTSLPLGGASTLPSGGDSTPGDHERDPDKNTDSDEAEDQFKDTVKDISSADQTDSGEKSQPGPADHSQSDEDAAPKPPGYVHKEVVRIDKVCAKDGQAPLNRDRESTKNMPAPPSLDPKSPVPQDSIQHANFYVPLPCNTNINNGDSNVDQSKTPEQTKLSDQTNSEENVPGPGVRPQSDRGAAPIPPAAEEVHPSGDDTTAGDHKSNLEENKDSEEEKPPPSPSTPGAQSPPQDNRNINPDPKNGNCDTSEEITSSDQTDSGEKNEKDSEQESEASAVKEPLNGQSGSAQDNGDGRREAAEGSNLTGDQQNHKELDKSEKEKLTNDSPKKDSEIKSEGEKPDIQLATTLQEDKDQQVTGISQQTVTPTPPLKTAQERAEEEGEKTITEDEVNE